MKYIKSEPENTLSKITVPMTGTKQEVRSGMWYILLLTLAPLYLLAIIGAIVLALVMLDRHFIGLMDFPLQQRIFILLMIFGIAFAIIIFSLSVIYAIRKIGILLQSGYTRQANAGFMVLGVVASIMLLPVILAFFLH